MVIQLVAKIHIFEVMKKILLGLLFCVFGLGLKAQDKLDTLANQFCACLNEKVAENEKTNKKTKLDIKVVTVMCLAPVFVDNIALLKEYYGEDFEINGETGEMIGREIGMRAVVSCPAFMKLAMESDEFKEKMGEKDENKTNTTTKKVTIKSVKETPTFTIVVRDDKGKEETLTIIRNGNGVADFVANFKQYLTSTITVKYMISEIYNATTKEFEIKKEIISIIISNEDDED